MAQRLDGKWIVSPQDVVNEFECPHKVALNTAVLSGALALDTDTDPALELLQKQGLIHENERLEELATRVPVVRLDAPGRSFDAYMDAWRQTAAAMDAEVDAIYQATLFTGDFLGFADFLVLLRDDMGAVVRDESGRAVYEPVDTKSARAAKRGAVLQVGAYAEALERLGRPSPRCVHLWLAGEQDWTASAGPLIALARHLRERVSDRLSGLSGMPVPDWAPPREACARCRFTDLCDAGRHRDRDLSMIQGIRSSTRQRLVDHGLATIDAVAVAQPDQKPPSVAVDTFDRLRAQAALQIVGEARGEVVYEVVDPSALAGLPERNPGDLWFDMEGDPYAPGPAGLEYMFGFGFLAHGVFDFDTTEAHDPNSEKTAFEAFMDIVMERWRQHPGMHVYHYADYERRTLQRLAQQYGTRENEVDQILQAGLLIDLYAVVRRALRFSTKSLSLKDIESVYGVSHTIEDVATAMDSVIQYERVVALRTEGRSEEADAILASIRSYNRLDCESTMKLDDWLRTLVPTQKPPNIGGAAASPPVEESAQGDPYADILSALLADLPADPEQRTDNDQARALLAAALSFHPRERRPAWWQLFELIKAEPDDLQQASTVLLADRVNTDGWGKPPRARKMRRDLTIVSETEDPRGVLDPGSEAFLLYDTAAEGMARPSDSTRGYHRATVNAVTESGVEITERSGADDATWGKVPIAVLPGPPFNTDSIRAVLADAALSIEPNIPDGDWVFPEQVWADLLLARAPRSRTGVLPDTGDSVDDLCQALSESADSYVAVQGPPGTGKTYVGSRAVARLAHGGWRIGVVAQSHAVVDNFLDAVVKADAQVAVGKEPATGKSASDTWHIDGKIDAWAASQQGGYVIGGTAWVFSRPAVQSLGLDLLVIDEAGQFALANAIACARGSRTVLLLGDPQQLPQVSQATHPEAIEKSVLEHIIGAHATMPSARGYFLETTYRMHPSLTRAVSDLQYEGRLHAAEVTRLRHLAGIDPGVIPIPVSHLDNTTSSLEEATAVLGLVRDLLGREWIGARHDYPEPARALTPADIIIVAAYNAQVRLLRRMLEDAGFAGIQVGTVDKFQGREEVVVIVSMATSSAEELPRGIEFLLSPNRLNVAISRAQWACFLVHSPSLLATSPSSVTGMQQLGAFIHLLNPADDR